MPDALTTNPESELHPISVTSISGGVNLDAQRDVTIGGDVVGRDKITVGYTVEQVSTLLTQISSAFQPKPFDGRCPYLGLDAFSEEDADRFFGRETLVSELVVRVKESRFVVIAGPSGSGKSSLVRAGLIHALKQSELPNSDRWLYVMLTPGRDPIESLALAMSRMARSPDAGDYIRGHKTEVDALHKLAESVLSDHKDQRAVIFADQFEEIFTQASKEDERLAFLNLLTYAATTEGGRVTVLFALRSDFVSNCATYPQLNALLNQQFMQVGAMQPDELVSAIARPALEVGLRIDPDLIAQIVNDMQDEPGALPLMQFALKDLFDARQATGGVIALTLNDYLARGGLRKALERHADAAFVKLSAEEQQLARTIFSGLIETGRGTQDTRRTASFNELVPANTDATQVKAVVQKLADARLITTDERDHQVTVTIAHEALIDAWPWLRKLINENQEAISLQNQIVEDAKEWSEHQRDASYLYSGARLATAREELDGRKITLGELAHNFVEAGIDAFESARRRRRRIVQSVISGLVILSLILAGLSAWAFNSQQIASQSAMDALSAKSTAQASAANESVAKQSALQSAANEAVAKSTAQANASEAQYQQKLSRSRELAAVALSQLGNDPERGLLIAIEADKAADTYEAQDALRQLLLGSRVIVVLRGHDSPVNRAQFSPDGKQIVTACLDKTARIWDAATGAELAVLRGHEDGVETAQFSPDGKHIVTASWDRTARIWDAATGREIKVLRGHSDQVWSAQFSPDAKYIVTASWDGTARIWDATTGEAVGVLHGHQDRVTSALFSPDGKKIATASDDGTARIWDAVTGQAVAVLNGHEAQVNTAKFSPDGKQVVTASHDETARVWDVASGQVTAVLRGHEGAVFSAQFSPDSKQIVTTSNDNTARVWDAVTGQVVLILRGHESAVLQAQFSPDGKQIVTAGDDSTARVWDAATGQAVAVLSGHIGPIFSAQFSPDGQQIVTASDDTTARVWNAAMSQEVTALHGHVAEVLGAQFSPDGKRIVTASGDGTARVWDATTGQAVAVLRGHEKVIASAQFSPDGKQIVTASWDRTARVWDATTGQAVVVLRGHEDTVASAQFSPDAKRIVTASWDGTARIWDAMTGQEEVALRGHQGRVNSAQFSPDAKCIVTGSDDGSARVWDAVTGQAVAVLNGHDIGVSVAQFSPDGHQIVTASWDKTARVWDAATGRAVAVLRGHQDRVTSAQFSPDGKQIVTASWDHTARTWDVATGQAVAVLLGHEDRVNSAQFSPNGKQIVTASSDKTARVWDAVTGQEMTVLRGHEADVTSAQFSPDGNQIVTASSDRTARVFVVYIEDLIELAQSRVTRELTCQEHVQYLHEDMVCPTPTPAATPTP